MQTDTWLTDTFYPDRCPLCNRPLPSGSNTCSACGFTAHEPAGNTPSGVRPSASRPSHPITPIPARASARRFQSQPGIVPRRHQATRLVSESPASAGPEIPPKDGNWHHESSRYEAASSLSSLSLIISETPTAPPRSPRSTGQLEHIDEIDTVPESSGRIRAVEKGSGRTQAVSPVVPEAAPVSGPLSLRFDDLAVPTSAVVLSDAVPPVPLPHIDEIDTVPEPGSTPSKALVPQQSATREIAVDAASWTAGPGSTSSLAASFIASHSPRRRRRTRTFNPLDRTRWWLLRPGHMEFLLWSAGSMLLFGVTFLILLATVLSVILPGFRVSGNLPISTVNASAITPVGTVGASTELHLTLTGKSSLTPGSEMHLQGAGFHPQSKIVFLLDDRLSLLDQRGQSASVQSDVTGRFTANLWLGEGPAWSVGPHRVFAREAISGHQTTLAITIIAVAATTVPGYSGVQNTPVAPSYPTPTPIPPTPTPVEPTATPVQPTPTSQPPASTPTSAAPPSASPTRSTTVEPTGTSDPGHGQPAGSTALGNSLNTADGGSLLARLAHLNPLIWLIGFCYFVSMFLLGMAGLLRRRRR